MATKRTRAGLPQRLDRDDDFTFHLTYPVGKFNVSRVGEKVEKFFAAERWAGRAYRVVAPPPDELSVRVAVA